MTRRGNSKLTLLLAGFWLFSSAAFTFNPEWSWTVEGKSGGPFATKTEAVAYLHSLASQDPRYGLLTNEVQVHVNSTSAKYLYEADRIPPILDDWRYFNGEVAGPGGYFSDEQALVDAWIAAAPGDPQCGGTTMTPATGWEMETANGYGGTVTRERRDYSRTVRNYFNSACHETNGEITLKRSRGVSCPTNYLGTQAKPGCMLNLDAKVVGKRSYCEGCDYESGQRGNPVNAITGDKTETEVDYTGPNGLNLVRTYHSRSLAADARLGVGWISNYHATISPDRSGIRDGLTRGNGNNEALDRVGGSSTHYISDAGTQIQLKKVGSDWHLFLQDGSVEIYNTAGKLTALRNPGGRQTTLAYDELGKLTTVTGQFGHQLGFEYDVTGKKVSRVKRPDGLYIEYVYTGDALTRVDYPDGTSRTYHYEHSTLIHHLTGVTDEENSRFSTFSYDTMGRPTQSEHAGGVYRYQFAYGASTSTVTDPLNTVEVLNFVHNNTASRRVSQTAKGGITRTFTVPSSGTDFARRITQKTDGSGNITKYAYTTYHRTSVTEAFGTARQRATTYQYLSNDNALPTLITEPNRTTAITYDGYKVLTRTVTDTSVTPNVSRTWTYTYNASGQVLTENGPRTDLADVTTYTYYECTTGNECGQLHTVENAVGHTTTYNSYNAHGQPTQITDANGLVTSLAYDLRQRVTDRCVGGTLPGCSGGELTHLDYLPTGLLEKVTNPDGSFIEYHYDPAHRLIEIEDGAGNKIIYTLDNMGNRTAEDTYDPGMTLRRTHTRVFNSLSQLWRDVNAAGTAAVTTVFGYDNNGNQTSTNAPLSRNSASLYDELNRLKQITDPASGVTQFGYDANDNLTSVTDPRSLVTSYSYSGFGDLTTQTSPDTGVTANTYDSGGNLSTSTDSRGAVTVYSYDAANRLTSASFTLGGVTDQTITYGYDSGTNQKGHLTSASDSDHDLAWIYDTHGRITGKGQTVGGVTLAMGYGYNASGQLGTVTLPSGNVVSLSYNANGQVSGLALNGSTTILFSISYDPFGPITGWSWGNGTTASRDFDNDGKVTQVDNANGASLTNYAYDDAFRITGITDAGDSTLSWTYGYDGLDRLTSASKIGTSQGWTYDANGNRLTETGSSPSTYTNSASSNRVGSISGALARSYSYDAAGNTLGLGSATFSYNNRGRMASASNAGTTAAYTYNALGQRIRRATSGATTLYVYDEAGHLTGEYTAAGSLIQETVWLGDIPVATLRPNGTGGVNLFYVHADHLNTPRLVTDTSNNIRWRWDSDPFGTTSPNQNPSGIGLFEYNLRFPGQQYDAIVGLHYNYFRDYDPFVGRYVESDPIGLDGGLNTYGYAVQSPILLGDPRGLVPGAGPKPPRIPHGASGSWGSGATGYWSGSGVGNLWDGYTPQDWICSSVAAPLNGSPCLKNCCIAHDKCYQRYGCNSSSWFTSFVHLGPPFERGCQRCNREVVECISKNLGREDNPPCETCVKPKEY